MLLVVLHDDQAANAEDVVAAEFDWSPFDLHTHWARVVVDLRDIAENLCVHLRTDCFGEVF